MCERNSVMESISLQAFFTTVEPFKASKKSNCTIGINVNHFTVNPFRYLKFVASYKKWKPNSLLTLHHKAFICCPSKNTEKRDFFLSFSIIWPLNKIRYVNDIFSNISLSVSIKARKWKGMRNKHWMCFSWWVNGRNWKKIYTVWGQKVNWVFAFVLPSFLISAIFLSQSISKFIRNSQLSGNPKQIIS